VAADPLMAATSPAATQPLAVNTMPSSRSLYIAGCGLALALLAPPARSSADDASPVATDEKPTTAVFDSPQIDLKRRMLALSVVRLAGAGRIEEAESLLRKSLDDEQIPKAETLYNIACMKCVRGEKDTAIEFLTAAVREGFADEATLGRDPDLAPLRSLPAFEQIRDDVRKRAQEQRDAPNPAGLRPKPAAVKDGVAEVAEDNTIWVGPLSRFAVAHTFPPADPAAPITTGKGVVGDLLREWQKEGTAAGLHGFLYDNRDADHSNMDYERFPALTRIEYSPAAQQATTAMFELGKLHWGVQILFVHNAPLIGNASVAAVSGPSWRSMTRKPMSNGTAMTLLADQYANNMLYFYPEHRDHDAEAEDGFGDVYPANTPYVITSQGSSGTDQPFLAAVASTIAALRPETQRFLLEKRLLIPTVQMIFRTCRKPVADRDAYCSGIAHPPVFDGASLDVERMVRMAHDLLPGEVPPLVRLNVDDEDLGRPGIDYFEAGPAERMFDTVSAVARTARSARYRRRMVVSVRETKDPNGRPLTFLWKLLRGDESRVTIKPLDDAGTSAELLVDWHPRGVYAGGDLPCTRVDIGVFADNGARLSAPAFVTWYFPANERRTYEDVPATADAKRQDAVNGDAPRRIVSIERLPAGAKASYVDPLIVTPAAWSDTYRYDARGDLLGWTRHADGQTDEFTRDGAIVVAADGQGRPVRASTVDYVREQASPDQPPKLRSLPGPEVIEYQYASDADPLGEIAGRTRSP
jgi:hypothetical protein